MSKRTRDDLSPSPEPAEEISSGTDIDASEHTAKYASLDPPAQDSATKYTCSLPPHGLREFATYAAYEAHYQQAHANRCGECGKNFPTSHFLTLHISEHHDPFVAVRRDRGEKVFACFVEDCQKLCRNPATRRLHMFEKHRYPRNYDFFIVDNGVDGKHSMLRPGVDANGRFKGSPECEEPEMLR